MPLDPIFESILAPLTPPTEKELTALRSMEEAWRNPELEVVALKIARLEAPAATRKECWQIVDLLKEIDRRAVVSPKGDPCSQISA